MHAQPAERPVLLLIAGCLALPLFAGPPPDSLSAPPFAPDSTAEQLEALVDADEAQAAELWELLQLPRRGVHGRVRVVNPATSARPYQLARISVNDERWRAGALVQRDAGEPAGADLVRVGLQRDWERSSLVFGDFRADAGLGWTVASTPGWSSSTDASAPLRRPASSVRPNLSSEEGRGWRGGALRTELLQARALDLELETWTGFSELDARESDGGLTGYSQQGDHTPERLETGVTVTETHAGGRLGLITHRHPLKLDLLRAQSRLDPALDGESQPARFRNAGSHWGATGGVLTIPGSSRLRTPLILEAVHQDAGGWGGSVAGSLPTGERSRLILAAWRATREFAPLHARPSLPFGDDPAGHAGAQAGLRLEDRFLGELQAVGAADLREGRGTEAESRRSRLALGLRRELLPTWEGSFRWIQQWTHEASIATVWSRSARIRLLKRSGGQSLGLRGQRNVERSGSGTLLALDYGHAARRVLGIRLSVAYLAQSGSGVVMTVVEPAGPGRFPVRRLGGNRLRLAGRLDMNPAKSVTLWVSGVGDHSLPPSSSRTAGSEIAVGLEWRPGLR